MSRDTTWEDMNARRSHDAFRLFRTKANIELREGRTRKTLTQRIERLTAELHMVQVARVLNVERSSPSGDSLHLPFVDEGLGFLEAKETRRHIADLTNTEPDLRLRAVVALENALDAHKGFLRHESNMTTDEIETRIIQEFEGVDAVEVHRLEPALGTTKQIKQTREKVNRDPDNGYLVDEAVAA